MNKERSKKAMRDKESKEGKNETYERNKQKGAKI